MEEDVSEDGTVGGGADSGEDGESAMNMMIEVSGQTFVVELEDNDCARAFVAMLPTTLSMEELNGNEKYCYLDESLPSSPEAVGEIRAGDVMLFGNDCVVVFYQSFQTPYTYTRIGHIDDTACLAEALGQGSAEVAFSL